MLLAGVLGGRAPETSRVGSIDSVSVNESANHSVLARSEIWAAGWSIGFAHKHSYDSRNHLYSIFRFNLPSSIFRPKSR